MNGKLGGRPKGKKTEATLEKEKVLAAFKERTMQVADVLLNSQLTLAKGQTFLYKIEKYWEGSGKNRILRKKKPQIVTAQWEIEDYLEGKIESGEEDDYEATYYFITTKEPNNNAIDSLLDRAFGKASQSIAVSGGLNISKVLDELEQEKKNESNLKQRSKTSR